jgi:hypothetical protein
MEIKDKQAFKIILREKVERYIGQFPIYFYGNIFINLILMAIITILIIFLVETLMPELIFLLVVLFGIFSVTLNGCLRNIKILQKISAGNYKFGIEEFEMDNAVEFIEELPMEKEEFERTKIALSFGKLIDVFEAARIISNSGKLYDLDLLFKNEAAETLSENLEKFSGGQTKNTPK